MRQAEQKHDEDEDEDDGVWTAAEAYTLNRVSLKALQPVHVKVTCAWRE